MREKVVYNTGGTHVDGAFEILASLQMSSAVPAISAGWATVEALLSEPNDRGSASERLATIVACAFPRAELTKLSYVLAKEDRRMTAALATVTVNRDRAVLVADEIVAGRALTMTRPADRAALERLRRIFQDPAKALDDVRHHVEGTFRRMYRQRNLVLHGGRANPVALRSCLRTCAPLVGAGMDRIAHNFYVNKTPPLVTAAQARNAMIMVAGRTARDCADLLP